MNPIISLTTQTLTNTLTIAFAPKNKAELQAATVECLKLSADCSKGPYGPIAYWDVSPVTDMTAVFKDASSFSGDLSKWDVSKVTNMRSTFDLAKAFNSDISKWDVSRVTDMGYTFANAAAFNSDVSKWDVSKVTYMFGTFMHAKSFNIDVDNWDVSNVDQMRHMFNGASSFSHKLCGKWFKTFNRLSDSKKKDMFTDSGGKICKNG